LIHEVTGQLIGRKSQTPGGIAGRLGGREVLVQAGRIHLYEGHSAHEVTALVRVAARLGGHHLAGDHPALIAGQPASGREMNMSDTAMAQDAPPTQPSTWLRVLLIVVAVTMDTVAQIQSHLIAHQYEGLIKKSRLRGRRG
jgi:hypothetical protein